MNPDVRIEQLLEHRDFVQSLARGLLRGREGADDVAQEAMAAAVTGPTAPDGSARAWLTGVARNLSRRAVRERRRRVERERIAARPEKVRSTVEVVEEEETRRRLVDAVVSLEEPYRTPVLLRYYDGLPPRAIARRLGLPGATVRSHLHRGLERLRARLDERHGGRRAWATALVPLIRGGKHTWTGALLMTAKGKLVVAATLVVVTLAALVALQEGNLGPAKAAPEPKGKAVAGAVPEETAHRGAPVREVAGSSVHVADTEPVLRVVAAEDGAPLGEAVVEAVGEHGVTTRAAADAAGRIEPFWSGRATLWASAPGRALRRFADVELGDEDLVLRLPRGTGIVLRFEDAAGSPVTGHGARDRYEQAGLPAEAQLVPEEVLSTGDARTLVRTLFGPSSRWRRRVPLEWTKEGAALETFLGPGSWRLFLERPGTTPWLSETLATGSGGERTLVVPLQSGEQRRVRLVAAESGAPLAGATVTPYAEFGDDLAFFPGAPRRADAHGELLLPLQSHDTSRLSANRNWWAETETHAAYFPWVSQGEGVLEVRVPRRGNVEGKAYRKDGAPAAGLSVVCSSNGLVLRAAVDADGSFRLRGVPAGRRNLALFEDIEDVGLRLAEGIEVPAGGTAEVVLGTPVGARIRGRITAGGRGVPGLFVLLEPSQAGGDVAVAKTDAGGRYVLEGVVPGRRAFQVALGDIRASDDFRIRSVEPLSLMAGEERIFDFHLPSGALAVRVLDAETDEPVRGTRVAAHRDDGPPGAEGPERFPGFRWWPGWAALSDERGEARLIGLPEGQPHRVSARAPDHRRTSRSAVVPGAVDAPREVILRLERRQ